MKESVGALGLTNIVIVLILLFSGYLCMAINQTKAQGVKNEIVNIVQKHNGFDSDTLREINEYMQSVGYRSKGSCDVEEDGDGYTQTGQKSNKGLFCIKCIPIIPDGYDPDGHFPPAAYYKIKVFFSIDFPLLDDAFNFNLKGSTKFLFRNGGCQ